MRELRLLRELCALRLQRLLRCCASRGCVRARWLMRMILPSNCPKAAKNQVLVHIVEDDSQGMPLLI